jgi:cytidylate kinase
MWSKLEATFLKSLGSKSLQELSKIAQHHQSSSSSRFIITIGGDQLTGKSTLSKDLSHSRELLSIVNGRIARRSAGQTMRELAAEKGVNIGELMSELAQTESGSSVGNIDTSGIIDINLDYKTCEVIAGKYDDDAAMLIMEGRQPSVMASYVTERVENTTQLPFRVYLKCSVREQALRYISREVSELARQEVEKYLPTNELYPTMASVLEKIEGQKFAGHDHVINGFRSNMKRDDDDKKRFDMLYGENCHYRNELFYDLIVDTTSIDAHDKVNQVATGWVDWLVDNNFGVKYMK